MKYPGKSTSKAVLPALAILAAALTTRTLAAKDWEAWVGAQSPNMGTQALAYLPNELWIHAGDNVRWNLISTEIHTVSFLKPGQNRPPNWGPVYGVPVGCPGSTPDGASFDGSSCVNSGVLGQDGKIGTGLTTYSVQFPAAGNFKFNCLIHFDMTGTIHVLDPSATLPHDQSFYVREAQTTAASLIGDASRLMRRGLAEDTVDGPAVKVTAGVGEIVSSGGGSHTASLNRFLRQTVVVNVGDTVEWTNLDPSIPHTVTFGTEPDDPRPPSANVSPTPDGTRQAVIGSPSDSVNSGLMAPAFQDRPNLAISPPGVTRFRVTFNSPGVFNYICALHDNLGMRGTVIVQ